MSFNATFSNRYENALQDPQNLDFIVQTYLIEVCNENQFMLSLLPVSKV